jgi:hypothetical protein
MATMEKGIVIDKNESDALEVKVYSFINTLSEFLPIENDRNRLSFDLLKSIRGEGDSFITTLKKNKLHIENISIEDLSKKIEDGLQGLK